VRMPRVLVVTGTGTGVGKTVVTAAVAALAIAAGRRVAVVKPVQTGVSDQVDGDLAEVGRLAGVSALHEGIRLPEPLAPQAAARRAAVRLPAVREHAEIVRLLAAQQDLVLLEGAGGLLVRLDAADGTLASLAAELGDVQGGVAALVVVRAGLGALNEAELTVEALLRRRVALIGLVIGEWPADPGIVEWENLVDLPAVTGAPLLGRIPSGAGRLAPESFARQAGHWLPGLATGPRIVNQAS
jgi:dethiobiotin synthetase